MVKFKIFIAVISFFLLFNSGVSQNLDHTFAYAHKQLEMENYKNAISAYRRVLFFDSTQKFTSKSNYHVASCYKKTGEINKAHYFYDLAYNSTHDDSLKNDIILNKSFLYIIQQRPDYAMMELASLDNDLHPHFQRQATFYHGIIAFRNNRFKEAEKYFSSITDNQNKAKQNKLDSLFIQIEDVNKKNPTLAKYLSLIIPGLGQLYAGYYEEAANSFLLSAGFWSLYFYTATKYSLFDAILSIYPWFHRYYLGGFNRAEDLLKQKKQEQRNRILNDILELYKD